MADVKILLVEDESIEAMDIKRTLESFGYEVPYVAATGEDAIKKALEIMPDLILMDIVLKGETDGVEVASQIKDLKIPVIYLTAHSDESKMERAKLTGPYGYIIKPYDRTELKYAIELSLYKHKAEIKLKESERWYRSILENMQDAYVRVDRDGRLIMVSPSAARMYGFNSPQEMIGIPAVSLYKNPEQRSIMMVDLKKEDQVGDFEGEALRKDGTSFWVSMNIQFIYDDQGQVQGTEAFIRDITQRKKDENEIKKSENYYRTIFNHTGTATIIVEEDTTISLANSKFEKLSGYLREEIEGKKSWTDFVVEDDLKKMKEFHQLRRTDPSNVPTTYEFRFIDRHGYIKNIQLDVEMIPGTKKSVASLLDITESKKAENQLLKSQEYLRKRDEEFRRFIESAPVAVAMFDKQMRYIAASLRWVEDYNLHGQEINGKSHYDVFPEITDELKEVHKRALAGSILRADDDEFVRADGSIQYIRWEVHPWYLSSGDIGGIIIFSEDISERKKAEKFLRESEEKYKTLFESNPDYTILVGIDGVLQDVNKRAEQIIGLTKDKLIGKKFSELEIFPKEEIDLLKEKFSQTLKYGNVAPYISRVIGKNGEIRWVLNESTAITKGDTISYVLVISRDITFQKKAEDKLRESAERFRAVAESAVDAIVTTDANGNIIFFNDSLTKIFGYTKEEIKGKPLTILMPNRFRNNYISELKKFKESGEHRLIGKTASTTGLRKDGTEFPFEMSLATWKSGKKTYFTSIIRDITQQKIAEEQTKDHLKKLTILNQIIEMANKASNIDNLLKDIVDFTMDLLGCDSGSIYLLEENKKFSELVYHENYPEAFLEDYRRINLDEPPFSRLYTDKRPLYWDIVNDPRIARHGFKSVAIVPLYSAGRIIGSIHLSSSEKSSFSDMEKDILESIAMETGSVIAKMYSEAAIKDSLREKELLLKEIHHRVKNNMQIISSLLNLQSQYVKSDEVAVNVLKESQNRVKSMAMIHEKLYQSDNLTDIKFDDYIERLVSDLLYSYNVQKDQIKPLIEVEDIKLNIETAIPCGLIISELVSNSLKHAFPSGRKGELHLSLKTHDDKYELKISDNGIGIPKDLDFTKTNSLGLQLVNNLVKQVDGDIELNRHHGTEFKIIFKELKYKERVKYI